MAFALKGTVLKIVKENVIGSVSEKMKSGTVSAKIAPRLKCYKNASRLNRYNFPTDIAIDFEFSNFILHHFTMKC